MNNTPLVSVIMPVYKVERYLDIAVMSILEQSYKSIELILVDDCSPDNCGKICDMYAQKDSRVKVVHKPQNEGLGQARNTGMGVAVGEWILFIDSDDWIDANAIQSAIQDVQESVDIIAWGYIQEFEDVNGKKIDSVIAKPENKQYNGTEEIARCVLELDLKTCFNYAWNKLYKHEFLKATGILFDDTVLMEDFVFNIKVFPSAKCIKVLDKTFSHYRKTPRETLVSKYHEGFFDLCKMKVDSELQLLEETNNSSTKYLEMAISIHLKHLMSACMKECSKASEKKLIEQYQSVNSIMKDEHTRMNLKKVKVNNQKLRIIQNVLLLNNGFVDFILFKTLNFLMVNMTGVWRKTKKTS